MFRFLAALCVSLWASVVISTENHPQTNGKMQRFNKALVGFTTLYQWASDRLKPLCARKSSMVITQKGIALHGRPLSAWLLDENHREPSKRVHGEGKIFDSVPLKPSWSSLSSFSDIENEWTRPSKSDRSPVLDTSTSVYIDVRYYGQKIG